MFGSFMRDLGVFVWAVFRQIVQVTDLDGDNRGTIDPNG
jgi:hypothetical protein